MKAASAFRRKSFGAVVALWIGSALSGATITGGAIEVGSNIVHPNGNVYDQVLLSGAIATVQADAGQVVRVSFLGLNDEIVQVEFSGKGSLIIMLENASGPITPAKYNQPGVEYMRGHAAILINGSDATTNVMAFSVGKATAVNQSLFRGDVTYQGVANLALLEIEPDANFGGIRMGNVQFFASRAFTGIYAPDINVQTAAVVGDVSAYDDATPALLFGDGSQFSVLTVAGGDLQQPNGRAIQTKGFSTLALVAGTSAIGVALPQQVIGGRVERNGTDITDAVVRYPNAVAVGSSPVSSAEIVAAGAAQAAAAALGSGGATVAPPVTVSPPTTPPVDTSLTVLPSG